MSVFSPPFAVFLCLTVHLGPNLTLVFLYKHLDETDSRISETLEELRQVDPQRDRFYLSLKQ